MNKKKIRIEIDFETGEIAKVKAHSRKPIREKRLKKEQIDQLLKGPHTEIGKLVFTHSSPGCVTYILGGNAVQVCF